MSLVDAIAAVRNRKDLDEDERRRDIYALKTGALIDVITSGRLVGKLLVHKGYQFQINEARVTGQPALYLDVTFFKPPREPATHQITIVNPPVLPRERTGNERKDLLQALHEMLEGFDG